MTKQLPFTSSRVFRRTVLSYLLILSIPLLIFSSAMFSRTKETMEERQVREIDQKMELLARNMDDKFFQITMLGQSLIGSNWLSRAFSRSHTSSSMTLSEKTNTIQQLNAYTAMTTFARDFAVVLPVKQEVVNGNAWRMLDEYFRSIDIMDPADQAVLEEALSKASGFRLHQDLPGGPAVIQSADIISAPRAVLYAPLDQEALARFVEDFRYADLLSVRLVDGDRELAVFAGADAAEHRDSAYERLLPSSFFGFSYRVSFQRQPDAGFLTMASSVVSLVAVVTILAIAASLLAARVSYKPMERLLKKLGGGPRKAESDYSVIEEFFDKLSKEKEEATHQMQVYRDVGRNNLMQSLLRGFFTEDQASVLQGPFQIGFTDREWYQVLSCRVPAGHGQDRTVGMKLFLVTHAYCQEAPVSMTPVEISDGEVVVILRSPAFLRDGTAETQADGLRSYIAQVTGIEPSLVLGTCEQGLLGISKSYQNIKDEDIQRLLEPRQDSRKAEKRYYYPTDWEIQLIHHLKTGNLVLSQRIVSELQAENRARELPASMTNRVTSLLFETMLRVMEELDLDMTAARIIYDTQNAKSPEDNRWDALKAVVDNICTRFHDSPPEDSSVGDQMILYVQERYAESSLSLNELGERFGLSVSAVSRAFKASAKLNFIDYVASIRMEKAKELLRCRCLSIQDIARTVGYDNDTSFKRAFLRYEGITPKQYQEQAGE